MTDHCIYSGFQIDEKQSTNELSETTKISSLTKQDEARLERIRRQVDYVITHGDNEFLLRILDEARAVAQVCRERVMIFQEERDAFAAKALDYEKVLKEIAEQEQIEDSINAYRNPKNAREALSKHTSGGGVRE